MSQSLHHRIDQGEGIFVAFAGEMQIDHGGLQAGVAHVLLDEAQVHPGFEQMGGIAVAPMPMSA